MENEGVKKNHLVVFWKKKSHWKTSSVTSEKDLEEDCGDRYEPIWSLLN